jgi:hypothetical protein
MEPDSKDLIVDLSIDQDASDALKETARWTKIIAVVGLVSLGLLLLVLLFSFSIIKTLFHKMMPNGEAYAGFAIFVVMIAVAIIAYMLLLLFRFSTFTRKAIEFNDQPMFHRGLEALKTYFVIGGVFALIGVATDIFKLIKL